ncbi:hypothetical protein [Defluviimonas sp. SAOS-178_SWC]|uniref:hypothetical protein n=1 Tax=Defluviimonas sp. SAOS-178_SWC TaxID=3121287 RepID=UPI0032216DEC
MPQLLATALPAVFGATGSFALVTAAGGLTLGGSLVSIGASLLISKALAPDKPDAPKPEDIQLNIRQAVGPRIKHYGKVRAGGTVVFFRAKSGVFYRVVVHGHGLVDEVEGYYLNKGEVTLDGSGYVTEAQYTSGGTKRVRILQRKGLVPSANYATVEAIYSDWDDLHRLDGLWTTLTVAQQVPPADFRRVYPNNEPSIEVVANTTIVPDPRTGASAYSENAALIIADLIESPDGFNRAGYVDQAFLAAAADDADAHVALAAGGTEARWRLAGSYSLSEKPGDVLRRMLDACGGDVRLLPNGKIGIEMGVAKSPSVTLTSADVLEIQTGDDGPDQLDRYNTLPFTYVDRTLAFQQTEGDPWNDEARMAEDGEEIRGALADFTFAPTHRQGRMAAKIATGRANPRQRITARFKPRAILAIHESVISFSMPEAAIDGTYRVERSSLNLRDGSVILDLTLYDPSDHTWSVAEEGRAQTLPTPDSSAGIPAPTNFAAAAQGVISSGTTYVAGIAAAWDAPASDALTPVLEYKPNASSTWSIWATNTGQTSAIIAPLTDGAVYDLRLAFAAPNGVKSAYVTEDDVTALASSSAPAAPTGLSVSDQTSGVARVSFTASVSASIWKTEVYRDSGGGPVLIATFYTDPSETVAFDDSCGAGTFDWYVRSINVSGVANAADAGPETQTIT